jgi:hypothetical protein
LVKKSLRYAWWYWWRSERWWWCDDDGVWYRMMWYQRDVNWCTLSCRKSFKSCAWKSAITKPKWLRKNLKTKKMAGRFYYQRWSHDFRDSWFIYSSCVASTISHFLSRFHVVGDLTAMVRTCKRLCTNATRR